MTDLPWNTGIMEWFVQHRIDWLTQFFLAITFLGSEMGYIAIVVTVYWLYNKRLAVQLVLAIIATTLVNQTLKIIIRNPRPFVTEGTYKEKWAIAKGDVQDTLHSYSTPSGHAQGSSTFWWYLHLKVKSRLTFVLLPVMVLLIGISRVYLGVHYLEDVVLGWIVGFLVVVFLQRYDGRIGQWWGRQIPRLKYLVAIVPALLMVLVAGLLSGYSEDGQTFATLAGIFTGIVLGQILDDRYLNFVPDLTPYSTPQRIVVVLLRMFLGVVIVGVFLIGLDQVFASIAGDNSMLGFILRWLRYTGVGLAGVFLAPLTFKKLNLA